LWSFFGFFINSIEHSIYWLKKSSYPQKQERYLYKEHKEINIKSNLIFIYEFPRTFHTLPHTPFCLSTKYFSSKRSICKHFLSYSSTAIRKEVLDRFSPINNKNQSKTYAVSDYDLFYRISSTHHVYGIDEPLTEYRRHAGNLSSAYTNLFKDLRDLIESYYEDSLISEKIYKEKTSWIDILISISFLSL
jgi:hypothetical protein